MLMEKFIAPILEMMGSNLLNSIEHARSYFILLVLLVQQVKPYHFVWGANGQAHANHLRHKKQAQTKHQKVIIKGMFNTSPYKMTKM
jgi:hypothetical protein